MRNSNLLASALLCGTMAVGEMGCSSCPVGHRGDFAEEDDGQCRVDVNRFHQRDPEDRYQRQEEGLFAQHVSASFAQDVRQALHGDGGEGLITKKIMKGAFGEDFSREGAFVTFDVRGAGSRDFPAFEKTLVFSRGEDGMEVVASVNLLCDCTATHKTAYHEKGDVVKEGVGVQFSPDGNFTIYDPGYMVNSCIGTELFDNIPMTPSQFSLPEEWTGESALKWLGASYDNEAEQIPDLCKQIDAVVGRTMTEKFVGNK